MSNIYQVKVLRPTELGDELVKSTSVYAESLLEAKVAGAEQLGVAPEQVVAEQIPDVYNPTDAELIETWTNTESWQVEPPPAGSTGGSAYG